MDTWNKPTRDDIFIINHEKNDKMLIDEEVARVIVYI